ncbi:MAG: exopolysaccharide biosynthesis protein [Halomonadaceae bacterium]|nr:MAG: exopolysaccharide biosynthesis protein [Halomonadaceae bacterium]
MTQEIANLQQLLRRMETAARVHERLTLGQVMQEVGTRSFGPLLLLGGVIVLSPLSGIPTVPTVMAIYVVIIAGQMFYPHDHFWLPQWIKGRTLPRNQVQQGLKWLLPMARGIDQLLRPRLAWLVSGASQYLIGALCLFIALLMPSMELVPFSSIGAGAALTAFGLALISKDGVLALMAYGVTALTVTILIRTLL